MNNTKVNNVLYKTVGFMNCDSSFYKSLLNSNYEKKYFDDETINFPKKYKYSLGSVIERDVLVLMRCIYRALLERNFSFQ